MSDICLVCGEDYPPNGIVMCDDCGMDKDIEQQQERERNGRGGTMTKVITAEQIMTAQFWTKVEGEKEKVRTFALIPDEFEGETENLPLDDQVFYWCDSKEWIALGAGEVYGDAEVLACACDECEFEREGENG